MEGHTTERNEQEARRETRRSGGVQLTDYPGLADLVGGLPQAGENTRPMLSTPSPTAVEVGQALLTELIAVENRIRDCMRYLQAGEYDDEGLQPNGLEVRRRVAVGDCVCATETLMEVRNAMADWLDAFNVGTEIELDPETYAAVQALAGRAFGITPAGIAKAAILELARQPDADRVLAKAEQRRLEALRPEPESSRTGWPWTRPDGRPWTAIPAESAPAIATPAPDSLEAISPPATLTITLRRLDDVFDEEDRATLAMSRTEMAYLLSGRERCFLSIHVPVLHNQEIGQNVYNRGIVLSKGSTEKFVQAVAGLAELFDPLPAGTGEVRADDESGGEQ